MSEEKNNKTSCLMKLFIWAFLLCLVVCLIVAAGGGWAYYKLTKTNDLAIYLSNKLSKPNRYKINIESFKNTLPIITANNFSYNKISDISSLSVNVKELTIFPDYLNPKVGIHSFLLSDASMYLLNRKFMMNSDNIQLFGKYNQKDIFIASSTWKVFGGKIYLSGHIDTKNRPATYELNADLVYVRLQDILAGTKNKGIYTGDIYGKLDLKNSIEDKSYLTGKTSLSIVNGTYYKPELIEKINTALHKIGLKNTLNDLAVTVASSSFSLNGDFTIKGKSYETNNATLRTPWSLVRFSGVIGPKSALNGTFIIRYKNYSTFTLKVSGEDSKNLNYKISDNDKARLASIFIREVSKGTEKQIKKEGHRTNKNINTGINKLGKNIKRFWEKL